MMQVFFAENLNALQRGMLLQSRCTFLLLNIFKGVRNKHFHSPFSGQMIMLCNAHFFSFMLLHLSLPTASGIWWLQPASILAGMGSHSQVSYAALSRAAFMVLKISFWVVQCLVSFAQEFTAMFNYTASSNLQAVCITFSRITTLESELHSTVYGPPCSLRV